MPSSHASPALSHHSSQAEIAGLMAAAAIEHSASSSSIGATAAEGSMLRELLNELDDRSAADDEHLWTSYAAQQANDGLAPDLSLSPAFDFGAGARSGSGSRPVSAVLRAKVPVPSASDLAPKSKPASTSRSPLSNAQQSIAAELVMIDQSAGHNTANSNGAIRSNCKFVFIHPMWLQNGRSMMEQAQQQAKDEAKDAAAAAGDSTRKPAASEHLEELTSGSLSVQSSPSSGSSSSSLTPAAATARGKAGSTSGASSAKNRSDSRGSARGEEDRPVSPAVSTKGGAANTTKGGKQAPAPVTIDPPPQPPKERTLAHGTALVAARASAMQSRLAAAHYIPASELSLSRPLDPDNEFFQLRMERASVSENLTTYDLSFGHHSISVAHLRSNTSAATVAGAEPLKAHASITYLFDGQRFYESFEEGGQLTRRVALADVLRTDRAVWAAAKHWIDSSLLVPLSLPASRKGWTLFMDEFLDWNSCGVHLQMMRTIYDAELVIGEGAGAGGAWR